MASATPQAGSEPDIIHINDIHYRYNASSGLSYIDLSLAVHPGEFLLLVGPSGCGKTTLTRMLNGLIPHFYGGTISGAVSVAGYNVFVTDTRTMAQKVGFVFQNPDNQLFMNSIENEVAFGLENLGTPVDEIRARVAESLNFLGIAHLRQRSLNALSGGEKQKVAIASVLAMHPEIIVLDEPTAELDPQSADDILKVVSNLNKTRGLTIILIEHRIDRVLNYVSRVVVMEHGKIIRDGQPAVLFQEDLSPIGITIPPIIQVAHKLGLPELPLTLEQTAAAISKKVQISAPGLAPAPAPASTGNIPLDAKNGQIHSAPLVEFQNISFQYTPRIPFISDLGLRFYPGEFVAIMGPNGSGKTTLVKHINGQLRPSKGQVLFRGENIEKKSIAELASNIGFIFQYPAIQFFQDTVLQELQLMGQFLKIDAPELARRVEEMLERFNLQQYKDAYPRYLSVGEQQKVALASVLISRPTVLVLDEPTHGMDYRQKAQFMTYLQEYCKSGALVILVTHDLETVAEFCDRVIILDTGRVVDDGDTHQVLGHNKTFKPQMRQLVELLTSRYAFPSPSSEIINTTDFMHYIEPYMQKTAGEKIQ